MIPSLSEVQATSRKATRGAGLSWGLADEAGRATTFLWHCGFDALSALSNLLQAHVAGCSPAHCPLSIGTALCDSPPTLPMSISDVQSPVLLLSFIADLAKITNTSYRLSFADCQYSATPHGIYCAGNTPQQCATVHLQSGDPIGEMLRAAPRRIANPQAWSVLTQFESRTYAPATAASRLAGAGAGLSDND
jgi:hypothetical protein